MVFCTVTKALMLFDITRVSASLGKGNTSLRGAAINESTSSHALQANDCVPNCKFCGDGSDATYCDCGDTDVWTMLSCSPFPVKWGDWAELEGCHWHEEKLDFYAGGRSRAKPWYDYNQADDPNKNYYVFHSCDGAGLQMGDCMGDLYYVEQFFPTCASLGKNWGDDGCRCDDSDGYGLDLPHNVCPMIHPGTTAWYSEYRCGWLNTAGDWADSKKNFWKQMKQFLTNGGEVPAGSDTMLLYPWVCTVDDSSGDYRWYYGENAGYMYGDNSVKCWCDNEPASGDHDAYDPPRVVYAYYVEQSGDEVKLTCANVGGCGDGEPEGNVKYISSDGFTPW